MPAEIRDFGPQRRFFCRSRAAGEGCGLPLLDLGAISAAGCGGRSRALLWGEDGTIDRRRPDAGSTASRQGEMTDQNPETSQELELAQMIVTTLNLEVQPSEIDPEAPLYGEGLGLDSIDILEIALAISQTYGFKVRAEDKDNAEIFRSLRSLNRHIQQNRVK